MRFKNKKAFTIIELLVVCAIIGILATIVTMNFRESQARSRDASRKADMRSIQTALEQYSNQAGRFPSTQGTPTDLNPAAESGIWDTWIQSNSTTEWGGLSSGSVLGQYFSKFPEDPLNGKTGVVRVNGGTPDSCPRASNGVNPIAYLYMTDGGGASYKIMAQLEYDCSGLDDGGAYVQWYELWGGKAGRGLVSY